VRAFFFELHLMGIAAWSAIGRLWMEGMRQFCDDYKPSFNDLVYFDHCTRFRACELQRTKKKDYPTIASAFKHVLDKEFERFMNLAVNRRQNAQPVHDMRQLTYPIPYTDSTLSAALRSSSDDSHRRDDSGGAKKKPRTDGPSPSERKLQSQLDQLKNQIYRLPKGKGKGGERPIRSPRQSDKERAAEAERRPQGRRQD
jgi:hypothetical protein